MYKYYTALFLTASITLASCGGGEEKKSADDQERAYDWEGTLTLRLTIDDPSGEFSLVNVVDHESTLSLNSFAEQAFEMAFTGDVAVYGPTLFGEMDPSRKLDPAKLVDELEMFDTVMVEDLETGARKDTVVDMSFNKTAMTALIMRFEMNRDREFVMAPLYLAIGNQIFSEETGERRGVSNKFFVENMDDPGFESPAVMDNLVFYTDSLGEFRPHSFTIHRDISTNTMQRYLISSYPNDRMFEMKFDLKLGSANGTFKIENLTIEPIEEKKVS